MNARMNKFMKISFVIVSFAFFPQLFMSKEMQVDRVASTCVPSWKVNIKTSDVFFRLLNAAEKGNPYFSAQLFYQYHTKNTFYNKKNDLFVPQNGHEVNLKKAIRYDVGATPFFYGIDLAHCELNGWFSCDAAKKRRASVISIVRKAWKENKAIPVASWHIENPYVPHAYYSMGGESRGCIFDAARVFTLRSGTEFRCPSSHTNVPKEILYKEKYDDGKYITDDDGHWLPSATSTICGRGRMEDGDDLTGFSSPVEWFESALDDMCSLINDFTDENGEGIPVILRLFHEPETKFAWWGYGVSKKDYIRFFQYTVNQIRKRCPEKNVLFAYCKDHYWSERTFGDRYPGDNYVDLVGYDDYTICSSEQSDAKVIERMKVISSFAKKHGKVAALFETGNKSEYARTHKFLSDYLYKCIMAEGVNLGLVQLWSSFTIGGDEKILNDYKEFVRKPGIQMVFPNEDV